jgi:hypothetical protein
MTLQLAVEDQNLTPRTAPSTGLTGPVVLKHQWREEWLNELARLVHPLFRTFPMKPYRLTCGWPCRFALGRRRRAVGECHALESSKAGFHEIFISPVLENPIEVAGTVCHEMGHVAAGIKAAHGKGFVKVCRHVGLTKGRPTSAAPGRRLEDHLRKVLDRLGAYPHTAVLPVLKPTRPCTTVKLLCPDCACACSMSLKWLAAAGPPRRLIRKVQARSSRASA